MVFNYKKRKRGDDDPFSIKEGRFGNLANFSYRLGWTEDSYISGNKTKETLGKSFDFRRLPLISFILIFFLSVLVARAAWLQVAKGDYYYSMAEGNRIRIERVEPKRGIIYDRNRVPLVRNVANFLLYVIPSDLPKDDNELNQIITRISQILGNKTPDEIKTEIAKVNKNSLDALNPLFIADNIDYDKAMQLYIESATWSGVVLSNTTRRQYDFGGALSLSHILGYTGKITDAELKKAGSDYLPIDYMGQTGLEAYYESELRGVYGKKQIEVDALGKEKKIIGEEQGKDGDNLVLSIDLAAQQKLEQLLRDMLNKHHLTKGVAIVMDPNTGEIIASVSLPTYNNNDFAKGIGAKEYEQLLNEQDKPLFNRAISGEYPSGSTIKQVIAAAALQEGVINENTTFLSTGGLHVGQWFFPDWKAGGHGVTNVRKALADSVNTFFYIIGGGYQNFQGLGLDRIDKYERLFNLGTQTGVDLPGEATGFIPTAEWKEKTTGQPWYIGDTYHVSIGQGAFTLTPLQLTMVTSYFANGGHLYRPHFVEEILNSDDQSIQKIAPYEIRSGIISPPNVEIVREGMRQTITSGSATMLGSAPVEVAGKTGTAQWSTKEPPHAWFTGFAPYDHPQIAFTILIEQGEEGASVAVPVANEFVDWYFKGRYATSTASSTATSTAAVSSSPR